MTLLISTTATTGATPSLRAGLPDLRGSTFGMTVGYVQQGMAAGLPFVDTW